MAPQPAVRGGGARAPSAAAPSAAAQTTGSAASYTASRHMTPLTPLTRQQLLGETVITSPEPQPEPEPEPEPYPHPNPNPNPCPTPTLTLTLTRAITTNQVITLKERCRARQLPVGGKKDDLVTRLVGDGGAGGGRS